MTQYDGFNQKDMKMMDPMPGLSSMDWCHCVRRMGRFRSLASNLGGIKTPERL